MAAGLGFKDFVTGEVLTAADVDGYLMQGIWVFASAAARDAAVTSPQEGNACYLKDTDAVLTYSGSAWVAVGGSGVPANNFNVVTTNESTSSTSYTALTTAGAVTLTTGTKALVIVGMGSNNPTGGARQFMSFSVSGATTIAASDQYAAYIATNDVQGISRASVVTLTAGSNTFTTQFKTTTNTGSFRDRYLIVIDLGS